MPGRSRSAGLGREPGRPLAQRGLRIPAIDHVACGGAEREVRGAERVAGAQNRRRQAQPRRRAVDQPFQDVGAFRLPGAAERPGGVVLVYTPCTCRLTAGIR